MKVLLLGGGGLVGSALKKSLFLGIELLAPSRQDLDLADSSATARFISDLKPDLLLHAAAHVSGIAENDQHPERMYALNAMINQNVFAAAREVPRLIYFASNCAYSPSSSQPFREETILEGEVERSNRGFATAKREGIRAVMEARARGLQWTALVPASLYGPGDRFDQERGHVIPGLFCRLALAMREGREDFSVWGTGKPLREFLYVEDLAEAVKLMVERDFFEHPVLNIGSGEEIAIGELAREAAALLGYGGRLVFDPRKPDGVARKVLDGSRIKEIGWKPRLKLEEGLRLTAEWYQSCVLHGGGIAGAVP